MTRTPRRPPGFAAALGAIAALACADVASSGSDDPAPGPPRVYDLADVTISARRSAPNPATGPRTVRVTGDGRLRVVTGAGKVEAERLRREELVDLLTRSAIRSSATPTTARAPGTNSTRSSPTRWETS